MTEQHIAEVIALLKALHASSYVIIALLGFLVGNNFASNMRK